VGANVVGVAEIGMFDGAWVGSLVVGGFEGAVVVGFRLGELVVGCRLGELVSIINPMCSAWECVVGLTVGAPLHVPHSIWHEHGHASIRVSMSFAEKPIL
jgi:hypothetical protein